MVKLLLWFLTYPIDLAQDILDYITVGLLNGQTPSRWELEKQIKHIRTLLTYFENCTIHDPSRADIYEKTCENLIIQLDQLKLLRDGKRKIKKVV